MTTYRFTGPSTRRQLQGKCPVCGKKVTRSLTFEHTVNPFNRHPTEDRPKTWEEVRADVKAKADAWAPDFTCQDCEFSAQLNSMSADELRSAIRHEGYERANLPRNTKSRRADLCNERIAIYIDRLVRIDPTLGDITVPARGGDGNWSYRCVYEFPDRLRCIYGTRHGNGSHLSPIGETARVSASNDNSEQELAP